MYLKNLNSEKKIICERIWNNFIQNQFVVVEIQSVCGNSSMKRILEIPTYGGFVEMLRRLLNHFES